MNRKILPEPTVLNKWAALMHSITVNTFVYPKRDSVLFLCRALFVKCFIFSPEQDLLDLIPGSYVGRLFPKASNLKDLVVHAYKVNSFTFSFTPLSLSTQGQHD